MYAIIGSGFGLYGYLPALVEYCGETIVLPQRYSHALAARVELRRFQSAVVFEADEWSAIDHANSVVIAQRPCDQPGWISYSLSRPAMRTLLLEKPLSPTPAESALVLEQLARSERSFAIGYIFRYTEWGKDFLHTVRSSGHNHRYYLQWKFMAHHFQHALTNWKRSNSEGGGVIRFYGIQVIALLAEAGFTHVTHSVTTGTLADEPAVWKATFTGEGLPSCELLIDTRAASADFAVLRAQMPDQATVLYQSATPFGSVGGSRAVPTSIDGRVPLLAQLHDTAANRGLDDYQRYKAANMLWQSVELATTFIADAASLVE